MSVWTAFLLRDLAIEKIYRFNLFLKVFAVLFQLSIFYFLSRFFAREDYFTFIFIGLMFSRFFQFWINVFTENIRQEQYWGTAELIFLSPQKPFNVLISSISGKFLFLMAELIIYGLIGKYVFKAGFHLSFQLILPIILNCVAFAGLGLTAGSFIMYLKRGDPVNWLLSTTLDLVSGVYFPLSVFPEPLQKIAKYLPTTQALSAWRNITIQNSIIPFNQILIQFSWAVLFLLIGIISFKQSFYLARKKGELGTY